MYLHQLVHTYIIRNLCQKRFPKERNRDFQKTGILISNVRTSDVFHPGLFNNSPAEGLWGIIKAEVYYLHKFEDEKSLRSAIERYIHFYNYERFQERFGSQTPIPENKRIQKYKEKFAS
jgi:hypothetical protein